MPGLEAFNASCEKILAATDGDSLPLFAAINAEPRVDDAPGRAMQLIAVLREFRGSAHLLAVRGLRGGPSDERGDALLRAAEQGAAALLAAFSVHAQGDAKVLRVGHAYERATPWRERRPPA